MSETKIVKSISSADCDLELMTSFPQQFLLEYAVLPVSKENGSVTVLGQLSSSGAAHEIGSILNCTIDFQAADPAEVRRFITQEYDRASSRRDAAAEHEDYGNSADASELSDDSSVARLVDDILRRSLEKRASDIHIEPFEVETLVRIRVDGVMTTLETLERGLHPVIVSRIKIMARLKIEERRLPQDGRIPRTIDDREIDLRVSTIPTGLGERVVLRILDRSSVRFGMEDLGLIGESLERWNELISSPHGIVLVTGRTGSGKITTLYAALGTINTGKTNIVTVEDPVEYQIEGIGQIQVQPQIELTFATGLRSLLRQDPDVIMVGEIRDSETAQVAVQASLTGHLVLSTLHTNDTFSASTRLQDMGVEPYLLGSTLRGVLAQRLVRKLCADCREEVVIDSGEAASIGVEDGTKVFAPKGCDSCDGLGFRGRVGIFELLPVEGKVRELILAGEAAPIIQKAAVKQGVKTLRQCARELILSGKTTAAEVIKATESD
ncbi:MAG: Flp pilus assembly complex ATPase component TadA [Candidatus Lindowbacteria bacterium]|nr:Flp pilus assembly complex ATPase component TadA [Candidatus Lindowbacteria bacterium]